MPQPYIHKNDGILHIGAKSILRRKDHAAGIGLVAVEWSALEYELIELFSYVMFSTEPTESARMTAELAWNNVDSLKARLDLLSSIVHQRLPALASRFEAELMPEIRKRARERNRIVHGKWFVHDKLQEVILLDDGPNFFSYSVKDFDQVADRIRGTWHALRDFLTLAHAQMLVR